MPAFDLYQPTLSEDKDVMLKNLLNAYIETTQQLQWLLGHLDNSNITSLTTDKLIAGTALIGTALIDTLTVGSNVSQGTAARTFNATPTTPYTVGDLWTGGTAGDLKRCIVTRLTGSYNAADWELATNYDNVQTVIDGGLVTTGTLQLSDGTDIKSGVTAEGSGDDNVRFWAGDTYENRAIAPFRVMQDGSIYAKDATFGGFSNLAVSANYNTGIGYNALNLNTDGDYNVALGFEAMYNNISGDYNVGIGYQVLYKNASGNNNIALGYQALFSNVNGHFNSALGYQSLYLNNIGDYNVALGYGSLDNNTEGSYNSANGVHALRYNTTGSNNTALGHTAMESNVGGTYNVAIGYDSLYTDVRSNYNVAVGAFTGYPSIGIPTTSVASGGNVDTGTHYYVYSYVINGVDHFSSFGSATTTSVNKTVNHTDIPVYSGPETITAKTLYRTVVSGGATATCTVSGGVITSITLTNGGSGYGTSAVVNVISKAGGGASITATTIVGGVIDQSDLTIVAGGSGYTVAPDIIITKYPANNPFEFYKVADLGLSDTTYSDTSSDVTIMANTTISDGIRGSIALGYGAQITGSGQLIIGGTYAPVSDTYFGGVYHHTSGTAGLSHTLHSMGGNGTNKAGGDLTLAGGQGTGSATGGALIFKTSPTGASGSLFNSLMEVMRVTSGTSALTWDSYTKAMLHMDGTDTSTTFTDEISKTWTANGNAQIDTAQKKFGTASGLFDGTTDWVDTPDHADFDVGNGDFTIDTWIKKNANGVYLYICGQGGASGSAADSAFAIQCNSNNTLSGYIYYGSSYKGATSTGTITDTNWHHIALVRYGNTMKLYIDGTNDGSVDVTGVTVNNAAFKLAVGRLGEYVSDTFNGWIDEFRFSKGIARWTANFTPETSAYSASVSTGYAGNVLLGSSATDSSASKVLSIGNGVAPAAHVDDTIQIYATDISGGDSTLGLMVEAAVAVDVDETKFSHKLPVKINGTTYNIMLCAT